MIARAVGERAQRQHVRQVGARHGEAHGLGARRQQQRVPGHLPPVGQREPAPLERHLRHPRASGQLDALLPEEGRGAQRQPLLGRGPREVVLREVGPVDGRRRIGAQEVDLAGVTLAAQRRRGGAACGARAHDDDRARRRRGSHGRGVGLARADADASVRARDVEAGQGVQRGAALGVARAQIEAGVVPGAPDRVADDDALAQGAAVVRAGRADGEHVGAAADEQHRLAARVAQQASRPRRASPRLSPPRDPDPTACFGRHP